jgi:hypothetical protein
MRQRKSAAPPQAFRGTAAVPGGGRIIGFQVTGGMNEWFYTLSEKMPDFSPAAREGFRDWLRAAYAGDEAALRRAWRNDAVTFATATVPGRAERFRLDVNLLRDPVRSRAVTDFHQFMSETNADALRHFCGIVKRETGGRLLAGAFYGYLLNAAAGYSGGFAPVHWGHNALRRVLAAPEVDFLCAPNHYTWTGPGGFDGSQSLPASVQLHGKLWMSELDQLTFLGRGASMQRSQNRRPWASPTPSRDGTLARMKREFAQALTGRRGLWWMEQDRNFCRYQHPDILGLIARMRELAQRAAATPAESVTQIAVVISETTPHHLKPGSELLHPLRYAQIMYHLSRVGAPFDVLLTTDLAQPALRPYALYLVLDTIYFDAAERAAITRVTRRPGVTSLWMFAPGLLSEAGIVPEAMHELTGLRLRHDPLEKSSSPGAPLQLYLVNHDHPITRGLRPGLVFGTDAAIGPMVYVDDAEAVPLGRLIKQHTRSGPIGLAVKEQGGWKSVFCAVPNLPADLLRHVARFAGVHIYSDRDDVVYADRRFLAVHTLAAGERRVSLPRVADVHDAFTGEPVAGRTTRFNVKLAAEDTVVYELLHPV